MPADKIKPPGTHRTQRTQGDTEDTDTFPTQEVLLGAPLLHAPGARMTVVELTPSNYLTLYRHNSHIYNIYIYIYIYIYVFFYIIYIYRYGTSGVIHVWYIRNPGILESRIPGFR